MTMIVERLVFQAKYGMADDLVAVIREGSSLLKKAGYPEGRILTDISGRMFTIVWESNFESLAAYEAMRHKVFGLPEFAPWFAKMQPLVDSGLTELYTVH